MIGKRRGFTCGKGIERKTKHGSRGNYLNQALVVIDACQALIDGVYHEQCVVEKLVTNIKTVVQKALDKEISIIFISDAYVAKRMISFV